MEKIGKYEIVRELGVGATSTVYLANDPFSEQQVAVKLFDLSMLHDPSRAKVYRKLLMTEASLAGKLSHPHIAKIIDAMMEGEVNYVVMEYVEGGTLEQFTDVDKLLPVESIAEIAYKCCKALEYAQQQGVIHRDIKPANIMLEGETDIKVTDFGAAALQSDQSTQVTGVGSPAYMSPEQVREEKLTHQTDIYSLGVVMYKLLTGKLPFDATNNSSMIYNIINIEPAPPSKFHPEMPAEMDEIVQRAMAKDTNKRYQTWDEFANDLVGFSTNIVPSKDKIQDTEKFDKLRGLGFFNNFSDVELWEVLRLSVWQKVPETEFILRDGENGLSFFVLAKGTVRVMKDGRLLSLLRAGDCFGEMAHLLERDFKRSTDVIAKDDVVLIEISPEALDHASPGCRFQFSDAFLRMLVKRLSVANTRLSHLLADQG
ncbi:MAG: serine/threonine-protein kinase [Gallionella sp.]